MKIVFFAPHSAIWVHAFPEALVAECLQQAGHEVVYVTCGEALDAQCVAMSASGVDYRSSAEERRRVCERCRVNKSVLRERIGLRGYDMASLLDGDERRRIDQIASELDAGNYLRLEIDGVPVGRYALYELILHRKKTDLSLNDDEWVEYKAALRGALAALFAGRKILDRERPERVVTYNSLYSVNRVFSKLAELRGAVPYFLHAGGNLSRRLQTLMLGRDSTLSYVKDLVAQWPRLRDRPCPPRLMEEITAHFLALFSGESVFAYSSATGRAPLDVRARFGIAPQQRVLLATLSSPDERFAAETIDALQPGKDVVFRTQIDWIRALVRHVAGRPDLFLLIRVHPREFPNKREHVRSEHAQLLASALENLPPNARVNWPTDEIPLYELANHVDVCLNAWSSAGKELALLGIPVVAYSEDLLFYPADLNELASSEQDLFARIDRALRDGRSVERSRAVYRWLAVEYGHGLVDIADGYRQSERERWTLPRRLVHRLQHKLDPAWLQKRDCRRRPRRLAQAARIEETIRLGAHTPLKDVEVDASDEDSRLRAALARLGVKP